MPYNFLLICYGVNHEIRQQLTSSAILLQKPPPLAFGQIDTKILDMCRQTDTKFLDMCGQTDTKILPTEKVETGLKKKKKKKKKKEEK